MEMHGSDRRSGRTISLNALSLRVSVIFIKKKDDSKFSTYTVTGMLYHILLYIHRDIIHY